jgi:hypothetical protein
MPVVAISYVPTLDGVNLNTVEANYDYRPPEWTTDTVVGVLSYTELLSTRAKYFLEERTRFRGYKNAAAAPYMGYQVVAHYVFYAPLPLSGRATGSGQTIVDYTKILNRINAQQWVESEGVREIWLWNYFKDPIMVWESNMSSPTTPDISNSDRFDADLPIYDKTYVVYGYNYQRTQAEAVHNHGHQLESMFSYVDALRHGNTTLFWGQFVGMPDGNPPGALPMNLGRCGWTHSPPNTTANYDYGNETLVNSDCEDWRPDGLGTKRPVNASYWRSLSYAWPEGTDIPQKGETQFYLWWMQNVPGDNNGIPYGSATLENWWQFVADWDESIGNNRGL